MEIITQEKMLRDNTTFSEGLQYIWSASSIGLIQTCPRKYQMKQLMGWQSKNTKSVHLLFGGYYANALEQFYRHRFAGASIDEALATVIQAALLATWNTETCKPWDSEHNAKSRQNLIRTIIWYVEQYGEEDLPIVKLPDGKPAVEYEFKIEVDNDIIFSGILDRLVLFGDDPFIMDQKTTGTTISAHYFRQFAPNTQMSMYTFAGKAVFNLPVKGVIIDAVQIAVGFSRFERGFSFRTDPELNEWYDDAMYWIEFARHCTSENFFPMNLASCGNYGGCEFREICARAEGARPAFLSAGFDQIKRHQKETL